VVAREVEILGDGERIAGEAVPRVGTAVGVGRIAVAVAAEVERPHVPARGDEPIGDRRPHESVKSGRMGEQHRRSATIGVIRRPIVHRELAGRSRDHVAVRLRHRAQHGTFVG
jgi:hypothetical protein